MSKNSEHQKNLFFSITKSTNAYGFQCGLRYCDEVYLYKFKPNSYKTEIFKSFYTRAVQI